MSFIAQCRSGVLMHRHDCVSRCFKWYTQEVVDVVGTQLLALLDSNGSSGGDAASGIMEGHSWLEEAGGANGGAEDDEPEPLQAAILPSLAAALPVVAAQPAQPLPAAGAAGAGDAAAAAGGDQQQPIAGPVLPPRPATASVGTQAEEQQQAPAPVEDVPLPAAALAPAAGSALEAAQPAAEAGAADALRRLERRVESWATLQLSLAVLSVPALLVGVWLNRRP